MYPDVVPQWYSHEVSYLIMNNLQFYSQSYYSQSYSQSCIYILYTIYLSIYNIYMIRVSCQPIQTSCSSTYVRFIHTWGFMEFIKKRSCKKGTSPRIIEVLSGADGNRGRSTQPFLSAARDLLNTSSKIQMFDG